MDVPQASLSYHFHIGTLLLSLYTPIQLRSNIPAHLPPPFKILPPPPKKKDPFKAEQIDSTLKLTKSLSREKATISSTCSLENFTRKR